MDIAEFKQIFNAKGGYDKIMGMVFDNNMTWLFNRREYNLTDADGNPIVKDCERYGDFIPVKDYLIVDEENSCVQMKQWKPGVTAEERAKGLSKYYWWEVRHVENIQVMFFCDDNNIDYRGRFDYNIV